MVLAGARSGLFTFLRAMRASRYFGGATRSKNPESALSGFQKALDLLDDVRVDPEAPWTRSLILFALWGYCEKALQLNRTSEILPVLARWRPIYLCWMDTPFTEEKRILDWLEYHHRTSG